MNFFPSVALSIPSLLSSAYRFASLTRLLLYQDSEVHVSSWWLVLVVVLAVVPAGKKPSPQEKIRTEQYIYQFTRTMWLRVYVRWWHMRMGWKNIQSLSEGRMRDNRSTEGLCSSSSHERRRPSLKPANEGSLTLTPTLNPLDYGGIPPRIGVGGTQVWRNI